MILRRSLVLRTIGISIIAVLVGSAVAWADPAYTGPPDAPPLAPSVPYGLMPYGSAGSTVAEPGCGLPSTTCERLPTWNFDVPETCPCEPPCTKWRFQADAIGLMRSAGPGVNVGQTIVAPGGTLVDTLNANSAPFSIQPGMRLALSMRVDDQISWQAVYFGLQNWSGSNSILANAGRGIVATSPYTQADKVLGGFDTSLGYSYRSRLNNVELNRFRLLGENCDWSISTLAGFRYFQWNESFTLTGVDRFFGVTENVNSSSNNYLVGGQVGADVRRNWSRFSLDMIGKAGLYANFIQQSKSNLDTTGAAGLPAPGVVPISNFRRTACAAGVLDFSAVGSYQVWTHFSVRAGYQLLFVDGLALAPSQLAGPSHSGNIFLHGPTAGFEYSW